MGDQIFFEKMKFYMRCLEMLEVVPSNQFKKDLKLQENEAVR